MSEIYEPGDAQEAEEVIDTDVVLGPDDVDAELDRAFSPPEKPRGLGHTGVTQVEQARGETLDQRLAQEEPDPAMEVPPLEDELPARSPVAGEGTAGGGEDLAPLSGGRRAGRLVDPGEGLGPDEEPDLVAYDVGIDGGAASAEEAAMHIVDEDDALASGAVATGDTPGYLDDADVE